MVSERPARSGKYLHGALELDIDDFDKQNNNNEEIDGFWSLLDLENLLGALEPEINDFERNLISTSIVSERPVRRRSSAPGALNLTSMILKGIEKRKTITLERPARSRFFPWSCGVIHESLYTEFDEEISSFRVFLPDLESWCTCDTEKKHKSWTNLWRV